MPFTFATATGAGDPHVDTFDGLHHDVMIIGWFTWVKNDIINVQANSQLGCMPASIPNSCIRSVVVKITVPNTNENLVVSWGSWPPAGPKGVQNVVIVDSTGKNVDVHPKQYKSNTYLNGRYNIAMKGSNLVISPVGKTIADPELAVSVTIGTYLLAVTLPKTAPHTGSTNGLMGFFNGNKKDYSSVFRNRDGSSSKCSKKVSACGKELMSWAVTHAVTNQIETKPNIGRKLLSTEESEARVLPSYMPKVTPRKLRFCHKILKGIKINYKKYKVQLRSCLQDADSPSVARSISKVIKVAKVQQKKSLVALKRVVRKQRRAAIIKALKRAHALKHAQAYYRAQAPEHEREREREREREHEHEQEREREQEREHEHEQERERKREDSDDDEDE